MTAGWRLAMAAREPDQAGRLAWFRSAHPAVVIGPGEFEVWQACVPEPDGERVFTRHTLRELLDKLYEVFPPGPEGARRD